MGLRTICSIAGAGFLAKDGQRPWILMNLKFDLGNKNFGMNAITTDSEEANVAAESLIIKRPELLN